MIVDASVAFKWLVPEPQSPEAIAWLSADAALSAPTLILAEVGHAITKRVRRAELYAAGTRERFARLPELMVLLDDASFADRAFELSVALHHSFYDCVYLAAAEIRGEKLLTADKAFANKLTDRSLVDLVMVLGDA